MENVFKNGNKREKNVGDVNCCVEPWEEETCCSEAPKDVPEEEKDNGKEAEKVEGAGQMNLFGKIDAVTKKENKKEEKKNTKNPARKTPQFKEVEKHKIIYAGHEIEIEPQHALADENEIWEIYLKDRFPEFRAGKEYVVFSLGEKDQEGIVFPRPKAYKMG